jgi:hypothetical protein
MRPKARASDALWRPVAAPDEDLTAWRRRRLIRAGFEPDLATSLAADCATDLHALIELVERGCPPTLAARILSPLDHESQPC